MNRLLQTKRNALVCHTVVLSVLFAFYILLIYLYNIFGSDITVARTLLPQLCEWLYLGIEWLAFLSVYAVAIASMLLSGVKKALQFGGVYAALTTARQIVLFVLNYFVFGLKTEDVVTQLVFVFVGILLELSQYAIVFVIALLLTRRWERTVLQMRAYAARYGKAFVEDPMQLLHPARELPLSQDPIRASSLATAVLLGMVRVCNRMIFDISMGPAVDMIDTLWMIASYTFDVALAVASYFILLIMIRYIRKKSV